VAAVAVILAAFVGVAVGSRFHSSHSAAIAPTQPSFIPNQLSTPTQGAGAPSDSSAIAAKVEPGLVDVNDNLGYQGAQAAGTGMILSSSGEVLTNNHVVDGATSITVTVVGSGRTYKAKVVGTDPSDDVAVLQLEGASGLKTVPLGTAAKVAPGDPVVAIGNAGGVGGTPSVVGGQVEAIDQSITASDQGGGHAEQLSGLIETNAPIEAGDSGGPLVNTAGQVIGMDTAASAGNRFQTQQAVGFAIPIGRAVAIAQQIESGKAGGNVQIGPPGFLGVEVESAAAAQGGNGFGSGGGSGSGSGSGAVVAGVVPNSPAQSVGIATGDVIVALDGQSVTTPDQLTTAMQRHKPGDRVTVTWTDQGGQSHTATATLTTGPAD
jgi:S1-C subfamily serine protease